MKRFACIALALGLAACSASTPVSQDSPQPSGTSPSPAPSKRAARVPSAVSAVFVSANGLSLYDVKTDVVSELARGAGIRAPAWVGTDQIAFLQDQGTTTTVRALDVKTKVVSDLAAVADGVQAFAVSPDRQTLAYVTTDAEGYPHLIYQFLAGDKATQNVTTLARALGRDAAPEDQVHLEFPADGQTLLVVYTPADGDAGQRVYDDASQFQIRGLDGSLLYGVDMSRDPTMGVWTSAGNAVYYRTTTGLRVWTRATGTSKPVSSKLKWFDPSPSRDGKLVAYDNGAVDAKVRVYTLDVTSLKSTALTGAGFAWPVFASARTVWVQRATPCTPNCIVPVLPGPEVDAVDVRSGSSKKLALPTLQQLSVLYA